MSRDGDLDCSVHTDEELEAAIRAISRVRYPLNYANLLAERDARTAHRSSSTPIAANLEFPVLHTQIPRTTGQFNRGTNSLRLRGRGRIVFTESGLELHGRRSAFSLLGRDRTFLALFRQICNVEVYGDAVRFLAQADAESDVRGIVTFWGATNRDATEIARHLPERRTADYLPTLEEEQRFGQALLAATPHVIFTPVLVTITTLLFLVIGLATSGAALSDARLLLNWGSNFVPLTVGGEWYRLLTSVFLHLSVTHILINMLVLRDIGPLVERLFGSGRFLSLYLLAGVGGSLLSTAVAPLRHTVGASGAIFGMFGAFAAFFLLHRHTIPTRILKTYAVATATFVTISLLLGFMDPSVDNAAHVGGLFTGFVAGIALARPIPREANPSLVKRLTAPLMVTAGSMALIPIATHAIVQRHQTRFAEMEFQRIFLRFYYDESTTIHFYDDLMAAAKAKTLDDEVFVRIMESKVLPFWTESLRRLRAIDPPKYAEHRAWYERTLWMTENRTKAFEMMVAGAQHGDANEVRRGQELLAEGTRRIQQFGQTGEFDGAPRPQ